LFAQLPQDLSDARSRLFLTDGSAGPPSAQQFADRHAEQGFVFLRRNPHADDLVVLYDRNGSMSGARHGSVPSWRRLAENLRLSGGGDARPPGTPKD
jgi:hypothetical protein